MTTKRKAPTITLVQPHYCLERGPMTSHPRGEAQYLTKQKTQFNPPDSKRHHRAHQAINDSQLVARLPFNVAEQKVQTSLTDAVSKRLIWRFKLFVVRGMRAERHASSSDGILVDAILMEIFQQTKTHWLRSKTGNYLSTFPFKIKRKACWQPSSCLQTERKCQAPAKHEEIQPEKVHQDHLNSF